MIRIRKAEDRFRTRIGWLDSWHTFSFGEHRDREHMSFRSLRVINDDIVSPRSGFDTHPHRDMEIITYVLDGAITHKDSTGAGGELRHGDVQRMSAGSGILHSEKNASATEPVRLLQIWIMPRERGIEPRYGQKRFDLRARDGRLPMLVSADGREGSLDIEQDATLRGGEIGGGETVQIDLEAGRHAWVQVARGELTLNRQTLSEGDGAAISEETSLTLATNGAPAEVLVFDLA